MRLSSPQADWGAMVEDREQLMDRLADGEWLTSGQVAVILRVHRATVIRLLYRVPPGIRYRTKPGTGRYRECHPADVRRELAQRHGNDAAVTGGTATTRR